MARDLSRNFSEKRKLIEEARHFHVMLWHDGHPDFRTPGLLEYGEEVLIREHVVAFSNLIGKQGTSWSILTEREIQFYIYTLKIELASSRLDCLYWIGDLDEHGID